MNILSRVNVRMPTFETCDEWLPVGVGPVWSSLRCVRRVGIREPNGLRSAALIFADDHRAQVHEKRDYHLALGSPGINLSLHCGHSGRLGNYETVGQFVLNLDYTHNRLGMTDSFSAAKLARKKRQKWWGHHIPLAYAVLISLFLAIYFGVAIVDRHITGWLTTLGVSPSGVNLLIGTLSCGLGIWGIRSRLGLGTAWVVIFAWCLLSGIVALAKAFSFF